MKLHSGSIMVSVALVAIAAMPLLSQTQPAVKKSFEVASVKSVKTRGIANRITVDGGRFSSPIATVSGLLRWAYRPPAGGPVFYNEYQIIGAPEWIQTDRFSVEAKADDAAGQVPVEEMRLLVQALLADRFQLKAHVETRQLPVYNLVVARGGSKMKLSEDQTPPEPPPAGQRGQRGQRGANGSAPVRGRTVVDVTASTSGGFNVTLSGSGVSIPVLVNRLQEGADRTVVDKTGLPGLFDFRMEFTVAAGPNGEPTELDVFTALLTSVQENLGLKLESAKGLNDVLVIDGVQKPTEN